MQRIADYAQGRDNNFNLLRLIAASMVVYGHSYPFVQGLAASGEPDWSGDWLFNLTGMDSGRVAVQVFFVMSGFLVAQSLSRRPSLVEFFSARLLRILPGLTLAVLFCAFGAGLLLTTVPASDYLHSGLLRSFLKLNLTLRNDPGQFLPGVFRDNPYPQVVNGSLWTLPWEVLMYLSLGAGAALGLYRRRRLLAWSAALVFVAFTSNRETHWIGWAYAPLAVAFASFFYAGVLLWQFRDRVALSPATLRGGLALLALCLVLFRESAIARSLYPLLLAYGAIGLALVPGGAIRRLNRMGDYSYGVYVYAFPVQQSLMCLFPSLQPLQLCVFGLLATLLLAVPSWHLVEKPMLSFKSRRPRRAIAAAPAGTQIAH